MSAAAIAVDAAHRPYEPSAANTLSACVSGLTFRITFTTVPSASITNGERSTPMYFFPYVDFSTQTPYASAVE